MRPFFWKNKKKFQFMDLQELLKNLKKNILFVFIKDMDISL